MKITKRITSLALIIAFAFTSLCTFTVSAAFSDVNETNVYYEAITALVDDGTINGYEDGTFKPDNTITRAEFSKLLAIKTAPSNQIFSTKTKAFPDVAEDHWANAYIAFAVSVGAVNGYPDGTFKPEAPVTYGEAVKMIICGMGYGAAVNTALTPWHKGYIDLAIQIGLTKNAMSLGDNPAPRGIVAQLIYNIASTRVIEQKPNGQWGSSDDSNKNYGDNKDNVTSDKGILLGVTDYSLDATAVGRNRIQIDDEIYELSDNLDVEDLKAYIGYQVEYSYSGSEITKVIRRSGYNSEITIEPWQIFDVTDDYIEYYEDEDAYENDDITKVSFASDMYVIYNTQIVNPDDIGTGSGDFVIADYFDITKDSGLITLLSNDGNEKNAELATVESYTTYFANTPSTTNGVTTVYDRNYTSNTVAIDEDDAEDRVTKITSKDGKPQSSTLTAITNKSVVSIALPYNKTEGTSVIISTATATGEVSEFSSDYETIVIASKNYEVSPYYEKLIKDGKIEGFSRGDNGKFYLDYLGRIVFYEKNETTDPYGLVVQYAISSGINDSDNRLQIMTASGKATIFTMKSKLRVDGSSMDSEEAIEYLKGKAARADDDSRLIIPVKYKASGTLISEINTLEVKYEDESFTYSKTGYTFKGTAGQFTAANSGTNKATVYMVPEDSINDVTKYKQYSASSVTERTYKSVYAYDPAGTTNIKVVLCFVDNASSVAVSINASTPVYMIESINLGTKNNIDAVIVKCKSLAGGSTVEKYSTEADIMAQLNELSFGDMVKFAEEGGEITKIATVYVMDDTAGERRLTNETALKKGSSDKDDAVEVEGFKIFADSTDLNKYYQVILGTVHSVDTDDNTINYVPGFVDDADDVANAPAYEGAKVTSSTSIETIERSGKNDAYVKKAITDIKGYADFESAPEMGTEVLILIMNKEVKAVYIINDDYR